MGMRPANVPTKPAASPATKILARSRRICSCVAYSRPAPTLDENPVQQAAQEKPLESVIRELALALERLSRKSQVVGEAEDLVERPDVIARHVLGLARANHGSFVPMIDRGHDPARQRPL